MRKGLVVALAATLAATAAQSADRKAEAEQFVNALCVKTDQYHLSCEAEQSSFIKDYQRAFRGEYTPQRNTAFCLYTGCGGAIRKNPVQACAWRMVVLQSGHPEVDLTDTQNAELACGKLSATERAAAAGRTAAIMGEIAGAKGKRP